MNSIFPRDAALAVLLGSALLLITCAGGESRAISAAMEQRALVQRQNLVYVSEAVPGAVIDLRYAVNANVAGRRLYPRDMPCLMHRDSAAKLLKVQRFLEGKGYRLKIWDAWRPPSSHMALWYSNPNPDYVTPPENGLSFHCYGVAVDVTLVDSFGADVPMPSSFDEFSPRAWSDYHGPDPQVRENVQLLQKAMRQAGFEAIESEWWHYVDPRATDAQPVFAVDLDIDVPVRRVVLKAD